MHGIDTDRNMDAGVVIPYYVAASVAFFVAALLSLFSVDSFFGHYFQPKMLAITHIMALGWGTMIIFGALFQFLPVLLEVKLYSEKLSEISFVLMVAGIPLLIFSFWNFHIGWPLQVSSLIITSAIVFFAINIYKTAKASKQWNISADFIIAAVVWLLLTAVAGTLLAFNFRFLFLPESHLVYLKVHAHLGIVGWFVLLIIGVSSRLIPMFLLSSKPADKYLSWCYYCINFGLVGFVADVLIFGNSFLTKLSVLCVFAGLIIYGLYVRECFIKRVRKVLDTGMKQSLTAFVLLVLPLILLAVITVYRSEEKNLLPFYIAYGFTVFFGFLSTLILGQVYKTLPFIVWLKKNKTESGDSGLLPKDLFSEVIAKYQFIFHLVSFMVLLFAILLKLKFVFIAGSAGLIVSACLFNINLFKILSHLVSKRK